MPKKLLYQGPEGARVRTTMTEVVNALREKNTSPPAEIPEERFEDHDLIWVTPLPQPLHGLWEQAVQNSQPTLRGAEWVLDWTVSTLTGGELDGLKQDHKADLASIRWQKETGGLALPNGQIIRTSRESQQQVTGALNSIQSGLLTAPVDWKLESGWAKIDVDTLRVIAGAVTQHVAACFAAEKAVSDMIDAETITDLQADFDAAYSAAMGG